MPASKSSAKKTRAAQAVAARIANQPAREVAERLSVSRKTIQRDLASPHARLLIDSLRQQHEKTLRQIYERSLEVVAEGLEANIVEIYVDPETGDRLASRTEIPDQKIRLEAVRRGSELISLGLSLPPDHGGHEEGTITWEQFTRVLENREAQAG